MAHPTTRQRRQERMLRTVRDRLDHGEQHNAAPDIGTVRESYVGALRFAWMPPAMRDDPAEVVRVTMYGKPVTTLTLDELQAGVWSLFKLTSHAERNP